MRLVVASNNPGKVRELAELLRGSPLQVVGLDEYPGAPDLPEPYETFAGNAASKALAAASFTGELVLADDSGLEVAALDGRPGVYSSRYADSDEARVAKLLGELHGLTGAQRRARFVCVVTLARPGEVLGQWQGTCEGMIAEAARGTNGFGFDPVFLYGDRTFAEMRADEKNAVSHRGRALRAFAEALPDLLSKLQP
jgi:XTP/dITP diphosphohydrolase